MNKFLANFGVAGLLVLSAVSISRAQSKGGGGQPAPSQPSSGSNRGSSSASQPITSQPNNQLQPLYLDGEVVVSDTGKPPASPVSLKLDCAARTLQIVRSDSKGYFHFALGSGLQANSDFSAADETADPTAMSSPSPNSGGYSGFGTSGGGLTGCELRMSVAGYQPLDYTITEPPSLQTIDVGVLELRPIASTAPGTVSATSLMVPNNARKEYEQGIKDLQSNHLDQGTLHLEKAVALYDKYAVAWSDLGKAYTAEHQPAKARQAYEKAIAADSKYAPPYVGLAAMQVEDMDNEGAIDSISKAADADPAILMGVGGYIRALANFNLNRFDAAEQDLLQAEKGPHQNIPQLHAMFAEILMSKQDTQNAAAQMRAYLKEAPQGHFAEQMRGELDSIETAAANTGNASGASLPIAP
jgi:tetratricopeptide (TPR) repeat protein